MSSPKPVPQNTLLAYVMPGLEKDVSRSIRPCKITRDWMDDTPARYAYRCIPLTAANSMGWEILNPVHTEVTWTGKENGDQLHFKVERHDPFAARPHFGSGTITWYLPFLFRTPPDYGLLISGPANHDKTDVVPLDAFVRSDWLPFPFTMNWRINKADTPVVFKEGEPICRIFPYPLSLLNEMQLEIRSLDEDPVFLQQVKQWEQTRQSNYAQQQAAEQKWIKEGKKPELKDLWNSQYAKGEGSQEAKIKHQNLFKCPEGIDKRKV